MENICNLKKNKKENIGGGALIGLVEKFLLKLYARWGKIKSDFRPPHSIISGIALVNF